VRLLDAGPSLRPGGKAAARLILRDPALLLPGDRFIIRMFSPVITIGGEYTGGLNLAQAQCANSGKGTLIVNVSVSQPPNNIGPVSVTMAKSDGVTCNFNGPVTQWGKVYQIPNAAYTCTNGRSTTAKVDELTASAHGIEGSWTAFVEGGCLETGTFSAVRR